MYNSYEEEKNLSDLISSRQCNPDKDSLLLTESLLQAFASKSPFHLSYDTTSKLSRHLINDKELANKLHLRTFGLLGQATMTLCYGFLRLFVVIQRIVYPVEWVMYAFGKYSLKSLVELSLNGRKPSYLMKAHSWRNLMKVQLKLHNKIIHISIVLVIFSLFEIFQTDHSYITIPKSKQKEMCTKY